MAWPACQSRPGNLCPGWLRAAFLWAGRVAGLAGPGHAICLMVPTALRCPPRPADSMAAPGCRARQTLAVNMICWQNPGMAGGSGHVTPRAWPSARVALWRYRVLPARSVGSSASPALVCTPWPMNRCSCALMAPVTVQMQHPVAYEQVLLCPRGARDRADAVIRSLKAWNHRTSSLH